MMPRLELWTSLLPAEGRRRAGRKTIENAESAFANSAFSFFVARGRNYTWTTARTVPIEVRVA